MSFTVKNAARDLCSPRIHSFFYGATGSGKTRAASTWPQPMFLVPANEQSILTLQGQNIPYVEITKRSMLDEVLRWLEDTQAKDGPEALPCETLVVESLSHYVDLVIEDISASNKGRMDQQGWGQLAGHFRNIQARLRRLDLHVIFTALAEDLTDDMGKLVGGRPAIAGSTRLKLPSACDLIAFLQVQEGQPPHYWAYFAKHKGYEARTRIQSIPSKIENLSWDKLEPHVMALVPKAEADHVPDPDPGNGDGVDWLS